MVADLQERIASVAAEPKVPAAQSQVETRLQGLEDSMAAERASREATSAKFQERLAGTLRQVELSLAAVEAATAAKAERTEQALQGLLQQMEQRIASSAQELGDAALESLLRQAEKTSQRPQIVVSEPRIVAAEAIPQTTPRPTEATNVIRQRSLSTAVQSYGIVQPLSPPAGTSSGPAAVSPGAPPPRVQRAVSPSSTGRTLMPTVSMPTLRQSPGQATQPAVSQAPRMTSCSGPTSPATVQEELGAGLATSPGPMYCRGRSSEPHDWSRQASRSPDQRYVIRAPVMSPQPQRSFQLGSNMQRLPVTVTAGPPGGAISPPATHRGAPRNSAYGLASPRSSAPLVPEPPGQWVRQAPAALRKPFPYR
eukprot:TRINITY_DN62390_c0_g1_i1.p1 TRINITY_DN62390_c0_g1~~TRINITY_DN62390_c0_g1_i1.p1  ORF type:complete len:410 (+),score=60.86 TRINITY_DN62390_c0_g1_i1:132-1232(+)